MGDLSAYDFFRQETSHTDVIVRTEAMGNVILVCSLMTPEKVRADMIPYLQTKLADQDQVLLALARKLGDIPSFIGGIDFIHLLIPIIEALSMIEETVVRSSATTSAAKVLALLHDGQSTAAQGFLNMLKRLCAEDHSEVFYSKVSACQMIDEIYRLCSNDRPAIQELFFGLCRDEMTIVRRSATIALPKILKYVDPALQSSEFLELLKNLSSNDEHLTVKTLAVQNYLAFCQILASSNVLQNILDDIIPLIKSAADDNSWKIRLAIVKDYGLFANCFTRETITSELFPSFIHLIQDSESDVRSLACESAVSFINLVGYELFLSEVIPIAIQLAQDTTILVRKSLADMLISIAVTIPSEAVAQHLNDLIIKCLSDDDPSVKIRILSKIHLIATHLPSLLQAITPNLKLLYQDENWRVRKTITLAIPNILSSLGIDSFNEHYLSTYLATFKDNVAEVRLANATTLPMLVQAGNSTWVYERVFPTLKGMASDEYMFRITMLISLKYLINGQSTSTSTTTTIELSERFYGEIINILLNSSSDVVPNVRLATSIILGETYKRFDIPAATSAASVILSQIKPVLQELSNDKDKDVKYFATESLKSCR